MDRYVVTGFDDGYWMNWGASWIISLKELAKFDENILVVDLGISQPVKKKLAELGAYVLHGNGNGKGRQGIFQSISEFAVKYPGIFAVWDADVYFQSPIDSIFDLAKDKIAITSNPGFYACHGSNFQWLKDLQDMNLFMREDTFFYDILKTNFIHRRDIVDDTWNYTDVSKAAFSEQKVIHPSGKIKSLCHGKNVLFWERHKQLFDDNFATKHMGRKLVKSVIAQQE